MYLLAINSLPQAKPVLPEVVIGNQSLCLYLDPWAFSFLLFLGPTLAHWGQGVSKRLGGGLAASKANILHVWMRASPSLGQVQEIHTEEQV